MKENAAGIRYLNNNLLMQRSTIENESFHRPNAYGFGRLVFFGIELNIFGIKLDQWMHDGPGEEEVSLFFADDRVVAKVIAKAVGRRVPQNIFGVRDLRGLGQQDRTCRTTHRHDDRRRPQTLWRSKARRSRPQRPERVAT